MAGLQGRQRPAVCGAGAKLGDRPSNFGAVLHRLRPTQDYAEEEDLLTACKQPAPPATKASAGAAAGGAAQVSARDPLGGESLIESGVAARTYTFQVRAGMQSTASVCYAYGISHGRSSGRRDGSCARGYVRRG